MAKDWEGGEDRNNLMTLLNCLEGKQQIKLTTYTVHRGRCREMERDRERWREVEREGGRWREMEGDVFLRGTIWSEMLMLFSEIFKMTLILVLRYTRSSQSNRHKQLVVETWTTQLYTFTREVYHALRHIRLEKKTHKNKHS